MMMIDVMMTMIGLFLCFSAHPVLVYKPTPLHVILRLHVWQTLTHTGGLIQINILLNLINCSLVQLAE